VQVDHVLAGHDATDRHDLLIERIDDLLPADLYEVVPQPEVVAVEVHQPGLPLAKPDEIAGRILDVRVDVVLAAIRPG
jgi:hypothetical protein